MHTNNNHLFILFFLLLITPLLSSGQAQKLVFDLLYKDKKLGELTAQHYQKGDTLFYISNTSIKTRIITPLNVEYTYLVKKDLNKQLLFAEVTIVVNGKTRTHSFTRKKENAYIFTESNKSHKINRAINYSSVQLLFEEPTGVKEIYSEEQGKFLTLRQESRHKYIKSAKNDSEYYYVNGNLNQAVLDIGIISFEVLKATVSK
jgi:hypothetical protein